MRLPRATRSFSRALAAAALALAPAVARAQQPQPELPAAIQNEVQAAQDALARGVAEFDGPQQSRSIVVFDQVIARLEALGARALPPRGKDVLAQAYEHRGRAYFGIGLSEKASENFRQLVQLKPDYALSKERVSPKIVELYDSVKRTLVGRIAVSSDPPGATATLVSPGGLRSELGLTDFFPIEVLAGEYALEVARPGYRTETLAVSIAAEATETRAVPLTRVLASAWFVVEPAGVEIWIDGELRATAAGNLAPEFHEAARAKGLDVHGPLSPDTVFLAGSRGAYDGVLALYHDQAFIPIKLLAADGGVTVIAGLPYLRVSPVHGTAFDIAGRGKADPSNLIGALHRAVAWARPR